MDTWQIAHKILTFCKEQHSSLKWDIKSANKDGRYIQGSVSFIELKIEVLTLGKFECILGRSKIESVNWEGKFNICKRQSKIDFTLYLDQVERLCDEKDWLLCKQIQKIMLSVFTFILDEI